jgi:SurA N-terminal domain
VTRVALARRWAAAAIAGLAVLALPACDPDQPGSAAIVGGQRISETELQDTVQAIVDLKRETGQDAGDVAELTRGVLAGRVESMLVTHAAATEGLTISDGEVRNYISGARSEIGDEKKFRAALANSNIAPDDLDRYTAFFLLREKLATRLGAANDPATRTKYNELMLSTGNEVGVQISPRYGSWDPRQGLAGSPDDLSHPVSPSPAPTQLAPSPQ